MDFSQFSVPVMAKQQKREDQDRRYQLTIFKGEQSRLHLLDREEQKEVMRVECREGKIKENLSAIYQIYKRSNINLEWKK